MGKAFIDRTGESKRMKNGLIAIIVVYRRYGDIDVRFCNGEIVRNRSYAEFARGGLRCPMIIERMGDYAKVTNSNIQPPVSFLIDIEDLPIIGNTYWRINDSGYMRGGLRDERLHRLIMNAQPSDYVDHVNGDRLDNRRCNLRLCTNAENSRNQNMRSNNISGYKGVYKPTGRNKWIARITVNYSDMHLGCFDNKTDAARAYNEAALKHFGEFAKLNEI